MRISSPLTSAPPSLSLSAARPAAKGQGVLDGLNSFYDKYETPINVAGGAVIGAGIAHLCGVAPEAVMSTAGTGAFAGFLCDGKKQAVLTAGGAILGGAIGAFAGLHGPAIMGACGTGGFIGWLLA